MDARSDTRVVLVFLEGLVNDDQTYEPRRAGYCELINRNPICSPTIRSFKFLWRYANIHSDEIA